MRTVCRFAFVLLGLVGSVNAQEMIKLPNSSLASLLSTLTIIYSDRFDIVQINVFQADDSKYISDECDPGRESVTCPRSRVFVSLSGAEVVPNIVWRSDSKVGWKFGTPIIDRSQRHIRIPATACDSRSKKQPWAERGYSLVIDATDYLHPSVKLIPATEDSTTCKLY
jgi:hypothetical protein